jgi:hypothetical protein
MQIKNLGFSELHIDVEATGSACFPALDRRL